MPGLDARVARAAELGAALLAAALDDSADVHVRRPSSRQPRPFVQEARAVVDRSGGHEQPEGPQEAVEIPVVGSGFAAELLRELSRPVADGRCQARPRGYYVSGPGLVPVAINVPLLEHFGEAEVLRPHHGLPGRRDELDEQSGRGPACGLSL